MQKNKGFNPMRFFVFFLIILLSPTAFGEDHSLVMLEYHPVNSGFWETIHLGLRDGAFADVVPIANDQASHTKKDSQENWEARLATGLALRGMGLTYLASKVLGDVLKNSLGTDMGTQALVGLEDIAKTGLVDEDYLYGEIANDLEFDSLPKPLNDFISYQQGLFDLLRGFTKWSDVELAKVSPGSYWDFKLKYYYALKDVQKDKMDVALEKFTSIATNDGAPADIKSSALHQQGRLVFEKGDYPLAYKIFKKVNLSPRERGIILLERAWSKYYQKEYSKALGLLVALEAPYFDPSRTPEPYILKMLMYKELCHYDAALSVVGEFNKHFGPSIQTIRKRNDLRRDQVLVNLAVLDQSVEKWVNFLSQLKDERKILDTYNWENFVFLKNSKRAYEFEMDKIRNQLDWILKDKIRKSADQLLDWQEQLTFLDYQTRLDSLRVIKPKSEIPYKSEEIPKYKFDKTYWRNQGEIWFDELEDYKVFVNSLCEEDSEIK
jgi:hypothetical protein